MNNTKSANLIAMFIGIVVIGVAIYQFFKGDELRHYLMSFFIGLSLVGVSYINNKNNKKKDRDCK